MFISCATGPKQKESAGGSDDFSFFPSEGDLYFVIDRTQAKEFVDSIIPHFIKPDDKQKKILDTTNRITMALYKNDAAAAQPHFIALLEGHNYPSFSSSLALSFSPDWKKIKESGGTYWKAKNQNLSLAIASKKIIISDTALFGGGEKPNAPGSATGTPRAWREFQNGGIVSGWIPRAAIVNELLNSFGVPLTIPVNDLLFIIRSNDYGYEMSFRIETQSASVAKAAASMLLIARSGMAGAGAADPELKMLAGLFFANPPAVQGNALLLTTGVMDERQVTGLLLTFLLH